MARQRRNYTREFKVEAVKLVTEKGYSLAEAARSLGIGENLLRNWKLARQEQGEQAFPGHGNLPAIEEELRQLKAENKRLQMERDMGKKRRRSSPGRRWDLLLHRAAQGGLAPDRDVRDARRVHPGEGLPAHSEGCSQYASEHYQRLLAK